MQRTVATNHRQVELAKSKPELVKASKMDGTGWHRSTNTWLNMTKLIENEKLLYPSNPQMTDVILPLLSSPLNHHPKE